MILLRYYYQTAKTRALYELTDGPAEQPADNATDPYGWGEFH